MSAPDDRLPAATARAIALAAAVGTLALAAVEPVVLVGAIAGLALSTVVPGFGGSYRRAALSAGVLPAGSLVGLATVAATGDSVGGLLTAVGLIVAIATGTVLTDRATPTAIERTGTAALYAGLVAGGIAFAALGVAEAGGLGPALAAVIWFPGEGVWNLVSMLVLAAVALGGALFALPPAAVTTPSRYDSYVLARNTIAWWIALGTALAIGAIFAAVVVSWFVPPLEPLVRALGESAGVRAAVVAVAAAGVATAGVGLVVRHAWLEESGRTNVTVPLLFGSIGGVLAPLAVLVAVGVPFDLVAGLFGAGAVALVGGWLVAWSGADRVEASEATAGAAGATLVAVGLATGGAVAGATVDAAAGLETVRGGLVTLVAVAAGAFAYDVGRRGRTLALEVGREGATRRPQYVQLGWSASIAGLGLLVAAGGLLLVATFAPVLSVPSTVAVLAGLVALVFGSRYLVR